MPAHDEELGEQPEHVGLVTGLLNIPVQTAGRGLLDLALKGSSKPHEDVALAAALRSFHMARQDRVWTYLMLGVAF